MKTLRPYLGLIASILIVGAGAVAMMSGMMPLGIPLLVVGITAGLWQWETVRKSRRDPYDLSRLWETAPEEEDDEPGEPDEDWQGDRDTVYCYRCGHAVAEPFARCPDCGTQLR